MRALFCQPVFSIFDSIPEISIYASVFAFEYQSNLGTMPTSFHVGVADVTSKHHCGKITQYRYSAVSIKR